MNSTIQYETQSLDRNRERSLIGRGALGLNDSKTNFLKNPFHATHLWNDLVSHFRSNIVEKQRRVRLKCYESCFTGTEAVTLVFEYLCKENHRLGNKSIERENAVKVCRLLVQSHVIKPANYRRQGLCFEDSSSKLYRVSSDDHWLINVRAPDTYKPQSEILRPKNDQNNLHFDEAFKDRTTPAKSTAFAEKFTYKSEIRNDWMNRVPSTQNSQNIPRRTSNEGFSFSDDEGEGERCKNTNFASINGQDGKRYETGSRSVISFPGIRNLSSDQSKSSNSDYLTSISSTSIPSSSVAPSPSSIFSSVSLEPYPGTLDKDIRQRKDTDETTSSRNGNNQADGALSDDSGIKEPCDDVFTLGDDGITARQIILSSLLKLVDLPFLENIVHPTGRKKKDWAFETAKPPFNGHGDGSADFVDSHSLILKVYSSDSSPEEVWWTVAIKLLDIICDTAPIDLLCSLRNGSNSLLGKRKKTKRSAFRCLEDRKSDVIMEGELDIKSKLFSAIISGHRAATDAIWPAHYEVFLVQMYSSITSGKECRARKIAQLSFYLLPSHKREHLLLLLLFMKITRVDYLLNCPNKLRSVASKIGITKSDVSVDDCFEKCIIKERTLTPQQSSLLQNFWIDNLSIVRTLPQDVQSEISNSVTMKANQNDIIPPIATYCRRLSLLEYEEQRKHSTEQNLIELMNSIIDSTSLSLKEKKSKLKQFAKHHPHIYEKHFNSVL